MDAINPVLSMGVSGGAMLRDGSLLQAVGVNKVLLPAEAQGRAAPVDGSARAAAPAHREGVGALSPDALVAAANRRLSEASTRLEFIVQHDPAGVVVRLIDVESDEVIRQFSISDVHEYAVSGRSRPGRLFHDMA